MTREQITLSELESFLFTAADKELKQAIGNMLNKAIPAVEDENDALNGVLKNNINFNEIRGGPRSPTKSERIYSTISISRSSYW
jgi:hypothetical protein